jgi:hypothetical protein
MVGIDGTKHEVSFRPRYKRRARKRFMMKSIVVASPEEVIASEMDKT